jgi:hypothetical protein
VDEFYDQYSADEANESTERNVGFLAAKRDTLEALDLADRLFNSRAKLIELLREEPAPLF